ALSYARHALYNDCGGGSTAGWVHHTVASVSLELGAFSKAMDSFQKALAVAQAQNDNTLLLQEALRLSTVVGDQGSFARAVRIAGDVYRRKCDFNKALRWKLWTEQRDAWRPSESRAEFAIMLVRRVRLRLSEIYTALGDNNAAARQKKAAASWALPACAKCREPLADRPEPCMPESWSRRSTRSTGGECAECASPRAPRDPPPAPAPPHHRVLSQDFPFASPPLLREPDINSLRSDQSSQEESV
ncbi:unnamed protein product, partial [Leptidea sinapis]